MAARALGGEPRPQDLDAAAAQGREVEQRQAVHCRRRCLEHQARGRTGNGFVGARIDESFLLDEYETEELDKDGKKKKRRLVGFARHRKGRRLHRPPERQVRAAGGAGEFFPLPVLHALSGGQRGLQGRHDRHRGLHAGELRSRAPRRVACPQGLLGTRPRSRDARIHRPRQRCLALHRGACVETGRRAVRGGFRSARCDQGPATCRDLFGDDGADCRRPRQVQRKTVQRQARPHGAEVRHRSATGARHRHARCRFRCRAPSCRPGASGVRQDARR